MNNGMATIIDGVVAILLVLTIGYCILLNRRLKLLKADEQSLRATISELVTATEIAERAIGGLKLTVHECDMSLGERLRKAERVNVEIDRSIAGGKDVLNRLSQIVSAGRPVEANNTAAAPNAADVAKARIKSETKSEAKSEAAAQADGESASAAIVKAEMRRSAKAVAAAAEAFAERLRNKVHGLAA